MLIRVEPAGFSMYRVHLLFDREQPDGEDQAALDYLAAHDLEPRYRHAGEWDGRPSEELIFGGCYLGRHLDAIAQLQRDVVQRELLTAAISERLPGFWAQQGDPGDAERTRVIEALVAEFNQPEVFQGDESGELAVKLDMQLLTQAAERLIQSLGAGDGNRTHVTSLEG